MKVKSIIGIIVLSIFLLGALAYTLAQTTKFNPFGIKKSFVETGDEEENSIQYTGTPTGDDPWKEVDKLVAAYYSTSGIYYEGIMQLTDDNNKRERIIEENKFNYTILGQEYYYRLGEIEVVSKNKFTIVVNHQHQSIGFVPSSTNSNKAVLFSPDEFKKLMTERNASAQVTLLDSLKVLTIDNIEDPSIQGYHIYYDPVTYRIKRMLIGMLRLSALEGDVNQINEVPSEKDSEDETSPVTDEETIPVYSYYLDITYTICKELNLRSADFLPEKKFLQITGNRYEPLAPYRDYKIISGIQTDKSSN